MDRRIEKTCTRCENSAGVVVAVARTASRSFRRERRSADSSVDGGGTPFCAGFNFKGDREAGGLEVASFEELVGREPNAASRSFE